MEYIKLIEELKNKGIKKIIITGPQRSGTRFSTTIIANDLDLKFIDERDFGISDFDKFIKTCNDNDNYVIQAPALSHLVSNFPLDATIIMMKRNTNDIVKSEHRIKWWKGHGINYKKQYKKYFNNDKNIKWDKTISEIKYQVWNKLQKSTIKNTWFELEYESTKTHTMWVDKKNRNFHASQIKKG